MELYQIHQTHGFGLAQFQMFYEPYSPQQPPLMCMILCMRVCACERVSQGSLHALVLPTLKFNSPVISPCSSLTY